MAEHRNCPICRNDAEYVGDGVFDAFRCPRCGNFDYQVSLGWREISSLDDMVRLSGWVREQNLAGIGYARITHEIAARVFRMPLPRLRERALRLLAQLAAQSLTGSYVAIQFTSTVHDLALHGKTYSRDSAEMGTLLRVLESAEFIKPEGGDNFSVSVKGLFEAESLGSSGSNSPQGFVAMNFDDSLHDAWSNGFDPGIRAAGFHPFRIDDKDYVGGITDEVMAEVRRSRFVVADYTGQKAGVYFEAGFALGLGLPVIPTCRAEEIGALHFDIKHLNTLTWTTPAELADRLAKRIRAVIGSGPNAPAE